MPSPSVVVTASVTLTLDQLLEAIRQLDEPDRLRVAQVLVADDSDAWLATLIRRLNEREPADDFSDATIQAEINAVRHGEAGR